MKRLRKKDRDLFRKTLILAGKVKSSLPESGDWNEPANWAEFALHVRRLHMHLAPKLGVRGAESYIAEMLRQSGANGFTESEIHKTLRASSENKLLRYWKRLYYWSLRDFWDHAELIASGIAVSVEETAMWVDADYA